MKSLREGVAATRIADFLNDQLKCIGMNNGPTGAVIAIETGGQLTFSGVGNIYEEFKQSGRIGRYPLQKAVPFNEPNFVSAPIRNINYDETFHVMPYDARKSKT